MHKFVTKYNQALAAQPFLTKFGTALVLYSFSDYLAQRLERHYDPSLVYDPSRAKKFVLYGSCIAIPQFHIVYSRLFPKLDYLGTRKALTAKLLIDNTIFTFG